MKKQVTVEVEIPYERGDKVRIVESEGVKIEDWHPHLVDALGKKGIVHDVLLEVEVASQTYYVAVSVDFGGEIYNVPNHHLQRID